MNTHGSFIAYPETAEQFSALKAVMKALRVRFEITKEKPYNPDFVAKIEKSRQDYKEGKGRATTIENLSHNLQSRRINREQALFELQCSTAKF